MFEEPVGLKRPSIERALDILLAVGRDPEGRSLTELSSEFNLSKSHAHRFLSILEDYGLASQDPGTKRYKLGPSVLKLAAQSRNQSDVRAVARPHLEQIAKVTGESAGLWILVGERMYCSDRIESNRTLRMHFVVGEPFAVTAGAPGKVMLAFLPEAERERILGGPIRKFTATTITDPAALRQNLAEIHSAGYAVSQSEQVDEAFGVAAPIFDSTDQVVASIGISGPVSRSDPEKLADYGAILAEAARAISKALMAPNAIEPAMR